MDAGRIRRSDPDGDGKDFRVQYRAVCLEARPHPDFAGEGWWHDVDIVLDEAKKRGMKIWILDDAHFPTGQANGLLPEKYPERARRYLYTQFVEDDRTSALRAGRCGTSHKKTVYLDGLRKTAGEAGTR